MPDQPKIGKKYPGDRFPTSQSPEDVIADRKAQEPFASMPDAVSLDAYFSIVGITNPVAQAGMRAYTKVRKAPVSEFKKIFETY